MPGPGTLVGLLWLVWFLSWLIAARWTGPTFARQPRSEQLRYRVFIWAGALLLSHPRFLGPLLTVVVPEPRAASWIATPLVFLGLAWTWWARIHLGRLWSAAVTLKIGHTIIRSGPYRLTRHPIYSGLLLSLLATAVIRDSWAGVLGWVLLVVGFVIKLRQEERLLLSTLGSEYTAYQAQVPALVPRPW